MEKLTALCARLSHMVLAAREEKAEVDEFPADGEMAVQERITGRTFVHRCHQCSTHRIVDWPAQQTSIIGRHYMQPQWVFDFINTKLHFPVAEYFAAVQLPPRPSPSVTKEEGDYIPPEKLKFLERTQ
ncbi:hypothetical protein P7K49_006839 [Saguinus oedipus]|uniref:Uncharacterized protein n=1 Tax=Saguinus oedipus TaxID=9490 RepID=A0ABQ9W608_SAGOE|nr:hypothetical protein P7K49_006839 [Saguinus oedipus]